MKNLFQAICETVEQVEKEYIDVKGQDKKDIAINLINALVDIPVIPEKLEEKAISLLIDLVVFMFNKYVWKKAA